MIFPARTWESLTESKQGLFYHLFLGLIPVLLITGAIEGWAFHTFGVRRGYFTTTVMMDWDTILRFQYFHLGVLASVAILGAILIQLIGLGAHLQPDFKACFIASVYGLTPVYWIKILDGIPLLNSWICWGIGIAGVFYLLYYGIPICLRPDQTKAFGLFILGFLILSVLSGFGHWATLTLAFRTNS